MINQSANTTLPTTLDCPPAHIPQQVYMIKMGLTVTARVDVSSSIFSMHGELYGRLSTCGEEGIGHDS